MEVSGHRKIDGVRCYMKIQEGEQSAERRSTRPDNMEHENSMYQNRENERIRGSA